MFSASGAQFDMYLTTRRCKCMHIETPKPLPLNDAHWYLDNYINDKKKDDNAMIIKDFRYNTEQDINNIVANNNDDSK